MGFVKRTVLPALVLFLGTLWFCPQELRAEEKSAVKAGYGWSVQGKGANVKEAVKETLAMVRKNVERPDFLFLFSTVGYDSQALLEEVNKQLGRKVKIYGGTSCLGVMTSDGFHIGDSASMAMLGISSRNIVFGVGSASLDEEKTARDAGRKAVLAAIKNAGKKEMDSKPDIIFMTAAPGEEEGILDGIADVVGRDVPVFGGSSADNDITGKWHQFANSNVYSNGVVLAAVYTDLKVGYTYETGYLRSTEQGVVTRAKGRVIYEIDNESAAVVYNRWLGGKFDDIMENGGSILSRATFHPLAKTIRGERGQTYYVSIHPLSIDLPQKSLTVFANVNTGDNISLLQGNWEMLLNRCYSTPAKACLQGELTKDESSFAVFTFCGGTMLAIPEDDRAKMPALVKEAIGSTPFIGVFTFGEQGFLPGFGSAHGNLVSSMVVFGE